MTLVKTTSYKGAISAHIWDVHPLQVYWLPVAWQGYQGTVTSYGFHPLPREQTCRLL